MHGWITGDPSTMTVWEHLASGLRCHLVLQDTEGQTLAPVNWIPVEEFLPVDGGHSLAHLMLNANGALVEIECAGDGDVAACRICEIAGDQVRAHWEVEGNREGWQVVDHDCEVTVGPEGEPLPVDIPLFLQQQLATARQAIPTGSGKLTTPLEAVEAAVAGNTCRLPQTGEIITLSRHAAETTGAWVISNWQTFLTALGIAYLDPDLAITNVRTAFNHLSMGSVLAEAADANGLISDLSNPPVAAYSLWKIFQLTGDRQLLEDYYPLLLRWHAWWPNFRDGNYNHLLNWAAPEESGMPGHPLYEDVPIDEKTGVMRLDDIGSSSLWAMDAFALMRIALQLNDLDQATHLETEMQAIADRANVELWDTRLALYLSKDWDGMPIFRQSITALLTLAGRIPTLRRAHRLMTHFDQEFATPFLLPTVGSEDAAYGEQLPWRGRVSPLLNYLICEGLRSFGEDARAEQIALSGLQLIEKSWQDGHRVFASYNAITGRGDDLQQDTLSPIGALLSALGIGLLMDVEPWNGLRLGNLSGVEMGICGFMLKGDRYDVDSSPQGLSVWRNGAKWLETDKPAILRNISQTEREVALAAKIAHSGPLRLSIFGFTPGDTVTIKVNGQSARATVDAAGMAQCSIRISTPAHQAGPWAA